VPKNPGGWKPEDIYIDLRNSRIDSDYKFSKIGNDLDGYDEVSYDKYNNTSRKIDLIKQRGEDEEKFAVCHIEKSSKGNKVEIRLQKTKWSRLQFSWDILRRLDTKNEPIINLNQEEKINEVYKNALNLKGEFLNNSFCLHLILVSKNGNAILSRISNKKTNDYPSTWAATIGEQIEKRDFFNASNGEVYSDFVVRWVKRALAEELDIEENLTLEQKMTEIEEYVDMDSLRVLSVDFEGDIYNIALTCVLRLKINTDEFKSLKEIKVNTDEMTNEFMECSEQDIRKILLSYPKDIKNYHPSTYLRLLMYHLYSAKKSFTMSAIVKDYIKNKKRFKRD